MNSRLLLYLAAILLTGVFLTEAKAQKLDHRQRRERMDSILTAHYYRTPYDTNYVVRPNGKLTLKARLNQTGNDFNVKGTVNGKYSKANLSTSHKTTLSIGASYRGISASLSLNPAKMKGLYKDYELNLNYYSSRLSLDFSYQKSETLAGDIEMRPIGEQGMPDNNENKRLQAGDAMLKVTNVAAFYTFNHRRFSFPAAFNQSYVQRRSAGSWLAGLSYQGGSIKTSQNLRQRNPNAPDTRIYVGHVGIGGGYGYNLVIGRKWLFHLSMLPTAVVYNRNNMTINGERKEAHHIRFNMIFNERAAIVHNFSSRYFAGATLVMNNSILDDDIVVVNQNKWRARAFIGVRL